MARLSATGGSFAPGNGGLRTCGSGTLGSPTGGGNVGIASETPRGGSFAPGNGGTLT